MLGEAGPCARPWGLSNSSDRPTRGNATNNTSVNKKIGTESKQVKIRKERPITRRLRKMRGTSTGSPVRSRAPWTVVALHFATQVAEHQRARRDHQKAQKT